MKPTRNGTTCGSILQSVSLSRGGGSWIDALCMKLRSEEETAKQKKWGERWKIKGIVFILRVHMYKFSARPPHVSAPSYVWHWHTNPKIFSKTPSTIPPFIFWGSTEAREMCQKRHAKIKSDRKKGPAVKLANSTTRVSFLLNQFLSFFLSFCLAQGFKLGVFLMCILWQRVCGDAPRTHTLIVHHVLLNANQIHVSEGHKD